MNFIPSLKILCVIFACALNVHAHAADQINDTGMSLCLGANDRLSKKCAGTGQDGEFGRDSSKALEKDGRVGFSFEKLDAAGVALPNDASTWTCVRDKLTGLVWEIKEAEGFRGRDNRYRHEEAQRFADEVNQTGLCGHTDWRLPSDNELFGLVDHGVVPPGVPIDENWFPDTNPWNYWTGSPWGDNCNWWYVSFYGGGVGIMCSDLTYHVRLVRDGNIQIVQPTAPKSDRYKLRDGEATDTVTKLIWSRCSEGQAWNGTTCTGTVLTFNWRDAIQRAHDVAAQTGVNWRLPNVKELRYIVKSTRQYPSIDRGAFPETPSINYWASNPWIGTTYPMAGAVGFGWGGAGVQNRDSLNAVRLVRDSP